MTMQPNAGSILKFGAVGLSVLFVAYAIIQSRGELADIEAAAKSAGFNSSADMQKARAAGFVTADTWQAETKRLALQADAEDRRLRLAKANAEAAKAERDAKFQEGLKYSIVLRESMKNPDAFKLEKAYRNAGGGWCFAYRSTNSFNAIIPGEAVFGDGQAASTGDPQFYKLWSKHCMNGGENFDTIGYALKNFVPRSG